MKNDQELLEDAKITQSLPPRYCEQCGQRQSPTKLRRQYNKYNGKLSVYVTLRCPKWTWYNCHFDATEWFLDLDNLEHLEYLDEQK